MALDSRVRLAIVLYRVGIVAPEDALKSANVAVTVVVVGQGDVVRRRRLLHRCAGRQHDAVVDEDPRTADLDRNRAVNRNHRCVHRPDLLPGSARFCVQRCDSFGSEWVKNLCESEIKLRCFGKEVAVKYRYHYISFEIPIVRKTTNQKLRGRFTNNFE